MNSFEIKENKLFMKALLATNMFDAFFMEEASITTYNHFTIDGHLIPEFYTKEEQDELAAFSKWEQMRPICFELIKGKRTPVQFKIVLHAPQNVAKELISKEECTIDHSLVRALVCTIRFDGINTTCISATSLSTFVPDKSLDKLWDEWVSVFLSEMTV
ncbi:MAG: hypothetical protein IJX86_00965 [Lachnospiraceae bacterium]|nr:hypothetical protein [Lachnospiraceae bacterium]